MNTKDLNELLDRINENTSNWNRLFSDMAKDLMQNYCIEKKYSDALQTEAKTEIYFFEEIEFYFYHKDKHTDNNHVYPRLSKRGQWFVHYSGVDIAFETVLNESRDEIVQCGGILIRGLRKSNREIVGGPLRCLVELFNDCESFPQIKKLEISREIDAPIGTSRIGINDPDENKKKYRYYIKNNITSHRNTDVAQYHQGCIVLKPKSYKYDFNQPHKTEK